MSLIVWLIVGLIAGYVARFLVPGRDPLGVVGTLMLGLIGSFVGGLLAVALTDRTADEYSTSSLLGSIAGGVVALLVYRSIQPRGCLTRRRGARL